MLDGSSGVEHQGALWQPMPSSDGEEKSERRIHIYYVPRPPRIHLPMAPQHCQQKRPKKRKLPWPMHGPCMGLRVRFRGASNQEKAKYLGKQVRVPASFFPTYDAPPAGYWIAQVGPFAHDSKIVWLKIQGEPRFWRYSQELLRWELHA